MQSLKSFVTNATDNTVVSTLTANERGALINELESKCKKLKLKFRSPTFIEASYRSILSQKTTRLSVDCTNLIKSELVEGLLMLNNKGIDAAIKNFTWIKL